MVLSGSLALVAAAYPPELRGRKIGIVSACTYAGLSLGPVLGGYVTGHFGWRYVFLMPVPIGLTATLLCLWGMLECKTRGNLTEEEAGVLSNLLCELRLAFVRKQ